MAMSKITQREEEKGGKEMENRYMGLERVWSGIGWGLLLILAGILIFSGNRGWVQGGEGWLYFIIGIGGIFIIGSAVRFFARGDRWNAFADLAAGVGMVYIGVAFLTGNGDWWPLVFVPFGIGLMVKGIGQSKKTASK
jgi:hypothetical protein